MSLPLPAVDTRPPEHYERAILGMTKIEAAEEILFGEPYIRCPSCEGEGTKTLPRIHDQIDYETCVQCNGDGYRIRTNYGAACAALGRDMPTKPLSGFERKQRRKNTLAQAGADFIKATLDAPSKWHTLSVKLPDDS